MQNVSHPESHFSFLVGDTLCRVGNVVVTVPDGTWALSDSLIFRVANSGLFQLIVDIDGQELIQLQHESDVEVRGDYEDLMRKEIVSVDLPTVALPAAVLSVVDFRSRAGKVLGAEITTQNGAFSILLYPEDAEVRASGAIWEFVREHAIRDFANIVITAIT